MPDKKQFELEFGFRSAPSILYNFLTTPSGLSQWFAESVDINDDIYLFSWSGSDEEARVLDSQDNEFIRFQWVEGSKDEFFEFRIEISEISHDTILYVTDFAADYELDDQILLWQSQIDILHQHIGG